jgi:NADH-quinone oxidoreductase subunit K
MLNVVKVLMVAFARYVVPAEGFQLAGQMFAIFIMTVAAAEAAVGLAIVIAVYRLRRNVAVDELDLLKG